MENLYALILATAVLVMIPGPNVAIIVAKSLQQGLRAGFVATLGTTTGVALQLLVTVFSIAALVETAAQALLVLKWFGVVYLIWLGVRTLKGDSPEPDAGRTSSTGTHFGHGIIVALLNPKTLLFNAAFLPQFLADGEAVAGQMIVLSSVYLAVILIGDSLWALFAASAAPWLRNHAKFGQRLTGGLFVAAGIGLALSRRTF
jgi:threonine/homoserine/homoserine lactone efflux protein